MSRPTAGTLIRKHPRIAPALAFAIVTAPVIHFAWVPEARFAGAAPILTLAGGVAHAVAGAILGPRVVDVQRRDSNVNASLTGAGVSLLALLLFVAPLTFWIFVWSPADGGRLSSLLVMPLVAVAAFLAGGWALLLISALVGWALHRAVRIASPRDAG